MSGPVHDVQQFLDTLRAVSGPATTHEVRERVDCTFPTAIDRLYDLEAEGKVMVDKSGGAYTWSLSDDETSSRDNSEQEELSA